MYILAISFFDLGFLNGVSRVLSGVLGFSFFLP